MKYLVAVHFPEPIGNQIYEFSTKKGADDFIKRLWKKKDMKPQ